MRFFKGRVRIQFVSDRIRDSFSCIIKVQNVASIAAIHMLACCIVIRMTSRYELLLLAFLALSGHGAAAGANCSHSKALSFQHSLRKGIIKLTESSAKLAQESCGSQLRLTGSETDYQEKF